MNSSPRSQWRKWAQAVISLHFLLLLFLGLSRHWGYLTSINDLGAFDQAVWGAMHGQPLLNTSLLDKPINWLGFHFNPILLLFVPLYAIAPCPEWFTLAQALALSVAAWPIFLLACRIGQSETAGMLWTIAYLFNPTLLNAAAWDFHPVALAVPFIALALLAVEKADGRLLLLSCLPLLLVQEQMGLTVASLGMLWWLHTKNRKIASILILAGAAHVALVLGVIMPAFSPTGAHLMFASDTSHIGRYGWLGKSASDMALHILLHPWSISQKVLFDWWGWYYLASLLLPLLGFPLAALVYLLPALPDLAANLLSANPLPRSIFAYHSVTLVPVFTIAAAYGVRRLSLWWTWLSPAQLGGLALTASLVLSYALAPAPLAGAANFWAPPRFLDAPDPELAEIRSVLGSSSLSAQDNVAAHFSQRSRIYAYPKKLDEIEAIVLRLESPTRRLSPSDPAATASLASHLQMRPAEYLASIECLVSGKDFGVVLWRPPWLVLKRDTENDPVVAGLIRQEIQRLMVDWQVEKEEFRDAMHHCGGANNNEN